MITSAVQNGLGIGDVPKQSRFIARAAFSKGHVGVLDFAQSDADVTNTIEGHENSVWTNLIVPPTGAAMACVGAVFLDDVADNQKQFARLVGDCYVLVHKSSGDIAKGEKLGLVDGQKYMGAYDDLNTGDRYVAQALESVSAPTTPTLCYCRVNLVNGFGTKA